VYFCRWFPGHGLDRTSEDRPCVTEYMMQEIILNILASERLCVISLDGKGFSTEVPNSELRAKLDPQDSEHERAQRTVGRGTEANLEGGECA
jgi:hypothetical protein